MKVKDPVCGMMLDERDAEFKSDYKGTFYYFCSEECKETFDKNPERYASHAGVGAERGR